jgi:cation diffusion facilitator CzcD-associated flavoprotein CzcO
VGVSTPNVRYSRLTEAVLQRWPALNRVSYRFWQAYIEHALGRATVEPCWQRHLMTALCRWNLRLSVRDLDLRRRLTPDYQAVCKRQVLAGERADPRRGMGRRSACLSLGRGARLCQPVHLDGAALDDR